MPNGNAEAERRQIAISLLAAWREAREDGRDDVVAQRLAAVAAEGGLTAGVHVNFVGVLGSSWLLA